MLKYFLWGFFATYFVRLAWSISGDSFVTAFLLTAIVISYRLRILVMIYAAATLYLNPFNFKL